MNEENLKKCLKDNFTNYIRESIDSSIIFKYINEIETVNKSLNTGIEEVYNILRKRLRVDQNGYYFTVLDYECMLKKLKELKGSDNNG